MTPSRKRNRSRHTFTLKKIQLLDYLKRQEGGVCFDREVGLGEVIKVSPRQVRRYLKVLVAEGKITMTYTNYKLGEGAWANDRTITVLKENN